jgi:hypothetical protein
MKWLWYEQCWEVYSTPRRFGSFLFVSNSCDFRVMPGPVEELKLLLTNDLFV